MAQPFKERISRDAIERLALDLRTGTPSFPASDFVAAASAGLAPLELKARVAHVAEQLRAHLPGPWMQAVEVLERGSGAPLPDAREVAGRFELWPVLHVVERYGLDHPERSMAALRELTRRFSAEFAVRPYLERHPGIAWPLLERWTEDPDQHVRRLCSEGSRPRLPWGSRLRASVEDPSRGLAILERLRDDPEAYVRRSVANHLNDVCKDHPERALRVARDWLRDADAQRTRLVKHGLRTLLKAGEPRALALFGLDAPRVRVEGAVAEPDAVAVGEATVLRASIVSTASEAQDLRVDFLHLAPGVRGPRRRVVRGPSYRLDPKASVDLAFSLSLAPTTTRTVPAGEHKVVVRLNGRDQATVPFVVVPARAS